MPPLIEAVVSAWRESWALESPFRIAGQEYREIDCLLVQLDAGGVTGRGEAVGVDYLGETIDGLLAQVGGVADAIRQGISRDGLAECLPAGGARNALDCALWDLECKLEGRTVWEHTGIRQRPIATCYTVVLDRTAEAMAAHASLARDWPLLKIKLGADRPLERLASIRAARPDADLIVDANQSWDSDCLQRWLPELVSFGVRLVEQPLPRGADEALEDLASPIPLVADESFQDRGDLDTVRRRYGAVNIKLDKCGGLTEALQLAGAARAMDLGVMVGNMLGTSLAMAPALVLAHLADLADLDGPVLLARDRIPGLRFDRGCVDGLDPLIWG